MSGALERAARALADHFGCEWETMRDADRETITGYARAVLMAVRSHDLPSWAHFEAEAWRDGIDTILGEGEGE